MPGRARWDRREYNFDCSLDREFFDFAGIDSNAFKSFVAEGATDAEVAYWIGQHSKVSDSTEVVVWNNKLRNIRLCDMPAERQIFLEDYIAQFVPKNRPVYVWFDVYDLEDQRI